MLVVPFLLKSQIPAGSDAQHPTTILMNTDSVYSQNRSQGWFVFNTHNVNNVSGNVINLKTAIIQTPVNSTTVKIKVINLYDSTLNLLTSDTLHSGDTSLVFTASVTTNKWYYLQTIANYPCDTCVYNEAVSFKIDLNGELPQPQCAPYCEGPITHCALILYFYNPALGYPPNCYDPTQGCSPVVNNCYIMPITQCVDLSCLFIMSINGTVNPTDCMVNNLPGPGGGSITCNMFNTFNPTTTPLPYAVSAPACDNPVPTITICPSVELYLSEDRCGYLSTQCNNTVLCGNGSIAYTGEIKIYSGTNLITSYFFNNFPVPINTSTILPLLPAGSNSFSIVKAIYYNPCVSNQSVDCISKINVIVTPLTATASIPTNTLCQGQSFCFSYLNPSSVFNYSTYITGPNGYTFFSNNPNNICTGTLTTTGVYSITSLVAYNYANATYTSSTTGNTIIQNMYCNDTLKIVNTFTVNDCCANPKINNITFENVTFVSGSPSTFMPGNIYTGVITLPNNFNLSGNLTFKGNINVDVNGTFSKCDIMFSDGASLNIMPNRNVNFNQCYLHSCGIWTGIVLKDNASITCKHSVIEDAFGAIQSIGNIFPPAVTHPNIYVENTLFNKNIHGILLSVSITNGFTVKNSIFTSRNLNTSMYNIVLTSPSPPAFNTIFSPAFLSSRPAGLTQAVSFAYPAFVSKRGQFGIYIVSSKNAIAVSGYNPINIGVARTSNTSPVFENSTTNLFDYLNCGILVSNVPIFGGSGSEVSIFNNAFQNIFNTLPAQNTGNSLGAIYVSKSKVDIGNNIYSSTANTIRYRNNFSNCIYGLYATSGLGGFVHFMNNRLYNMNKGVYVTTWNTANPNILVTNNTATANINFFYSFNNTQINAAISSNTVIGGTQNIYINELNPNNNVFFDISNNQLIGAYYGILAFNAQRLSIANNYINISKAPNNLFPPLPNQAGIEFNNVNNSVIANNLIFSSPPGVSVDLKVRGINLNVSNNNQIYCNNIQQVGIAIGVGGNSISSIHSNRFCDATAPKAFYGIYGISPIVIGNIDGPGSTPTYHTANANVWGSQILGQFNIAAIFNIIGPFGVYYYPNTSSTDYPLVSSLPRILADAPNNTQCSPPSIISPNIVPSVSKYIQNPNIITLPGKRITDAQMFNLLRQNNTFSIIPQGNAYVQSLLPTNIGKFYLTDSLSSTYVITQNNTLITSAQILNNSILPSDSIDLLQKQLNQIYYLFLQNDSLINANHINHLKQLSQLCPYIYGTSIYQARALLKHYDTAQYISNCEMPLSSNNNHRWIASSSENSNVNEPMDVQVYPNPLKNGELTVVCSSDAEFILYDISGKVLIKQFVSKYKGALIPMKDLAEGLYIYKIYSNNALIKSDKLIIQK
ncbi:MAG: hypothetical protein OHK0036_06900 [Bacteroidia bacterium]